MANINTSMMDEIDTQWVESFIGEKTHSISPGSMIQGFVSIISWIDEDGNYKWRMYNTIDAPLSNILGLMDMAKHTMLMDNTVTREEE